MVNRKMRQVICKIVVGVFASAACVLLLSNLPLGSVPANADSDIAVNSDNFPDENFRSYVSQKCDEDHNDFLSVAEIGQIFSMDIHSKSISDLKGIEFFTALERLYCDRNQLTGLDLSNNTALKDLDCYNNKLTSLNVSNCTALKKIWCFNNRLKTRCQRL